MSAAKEIDSVFQSTPTSWLTMGQLIQGATDCTAPVAARILSFCSEADGFQALRQASPVGLRACGLTDRQVRRLQAALELGRRAQLPIYDSSQNVTDPANIAALLGQQLMWQEKEHFAVVCLSANLSVQKIEVISVGTSMECHASPRIIFGVAVRHGGDRIVVAHNHPSGSLTPSPEDLALTRGLIDCGKMMDIAVLDHLILGRGDWVSLRSQTALWY